VAVSAGSLIPRKGFDLLVDAWRQVAAAHPQWRLRIYGVGEQAPALTARIRDAGLSEVVSLEGFESDLASRFDEASLFVLTSRREGMPLVLLEAMAAGLPVVAADCPTGPAEVLDGGRYGVPVPAGDAAALAEGVLRVLADADEQRRLADAGAQRVLDFDPVTTARRWETLFEELADRRGLSVGR
jgi:glycosyltransferase involved in cell wall biosynthesis